jgi:hypothetical protein
VVRRLWLPVLVVAGCDRLLGLASVQRLPDAEPTPDVPDGPTLRDAIDASLQTCAQPVLVDDFTMTDPCKPWGAFSFAGSGSASASEGSGTLEFDVQDNTYASCDASPRIATPYGGLEVRVTQTPGGAMSSVSLISTALGATIYVYAGTLTLALPGSGQPAVASMQYDSTQMQFWRLVPDVANSAIAGDYSADGLTWMRLGEVPRPTNPLPNTIDVSLQAHAESSAGTQRVKFGYLLACP